MKNQIEFVEKQLNETGEVTRNWAVSNYITRLAAIMHTLKSERGYVITSKYVKTKNGKDFVYKLIV